MSDAASTAEESRRYGKRVLLYFVLFFVALIIVNAIFVTLATRSHHGVVTEHAYERGLAYNDVVAADDALHALGWQGDVVWHEGQLVFTLVDDKAASVSDAEAVAHIARVIESGYDDKVTLKALGRGKYASDYAFSKAGQWIVKVAATWQGQHYQIQKRLIIPSR